MSVFFQRLEDLRVDNDLTQEQVAELLHCQREVYRRYEKGTRQIPVDFVITLSNYYCCSTDYLLGLTNHKQPYPDSVQSKLQRERKNPIEINKSQK